MSRIKKLLLESRDAQNLFKPIFLLMMADLVFTLFHQPTRYWAVDFSSNVYEINILGRWLLAVHPLAFVYAFLIYFVMAYFFVVYSEKYRFLVFVAIMVGHFFTVMDYIYQIIARIVNNIPKDNLTEAGLVLSLQIIFVIIPFGAWVNNIINDYLNKLRRRDQ